MPKTQEEILKDMRAGFSELTPENKVLMLQEQFAAMIFSKVDLTNEISLQEQNISTIENTNKPQNERDSASREAGYRYEKMVYKLLKGVGTGAIKSYREPDAQIDLLLRTDNWCWNELIEALVPGSSSRGVLIEVKFEKDALKTSQFKRLCSLMNSQHDIKIGVFFTWKGASGFPKKGQKNTQASISNCRFTQVIFYTKYGKPIIVFNWEHFKQMSSPHGFVKYFKEAILDINELTGLSLDDLVSDECLVPNNWKDGFIEPSI